MLAHCSVIAFPLLAYRERELCITLIIMIKPMKQRYGIICRAKAFVRRCKLVEGSGVTLHSYRYAWAERALKCGYPERFAQQALGHNSKAVHHAYAKHAEVTVPSLDDWEESFRTSNNGGEVKKPKVVLVNFRGDRTLWKRGRWVGRGWPMTADELSVIRTDLIPAFPAFTRTFAKKTFNSAEIEVCVGGGQAYGFSR